MQKKNFSNSSEQIGAIKCVFNSVSFKAQVALVGPFALNQQVAGSNPASK